MFLSWTQILWRSAAPLKSTEELKTKKFFNTQELKTTNKPEHSCHLSQFYEADFVLDWIRRTVLSNIHFVIAGWNIWDCTVKLVPSPVNGNYEIIWSFGVQNSNRYLNQLKELKMLILFKEFSHSHQLSSQRSFTNQNAIPLSDEWASKRNRNDAFQIVRLLGNNPQVALVLVS